MVKFNVFNHAYSICQGGDIWPISITHRVMRFIVKDEPVRMEITPNWLRFHCKCKSHMKRQAQDKLCKRIISIILYIYLNIKKFEYIDVIKQAHEMYHNMDVWLVKESDKQAMFEVKKTRIGVEILQTGTRLRKYGDKDIKNIIFDKFCPKMIATIIYIYSKGGRLKL